MSENVAKQKEGARISIRDLLMTLSCFIMLVPIDFTFTSFASSTEKTKALPDNVVKFSGYTWDVKNSRSDKWGPGPNLWSSSSDNVWVDQNGKLHLKITHKNGVWYSAEVVNTKTLGYGTYRFYIEGRPDQLDPNVVLGLFTYDGRSEDAEESNYREIDIEFIKWGDPLAPNLSYTVQPYTAKENIASHNSKLNGTYSTHSFSWSPDTVHFSSLHGHRASPKKGFVIKEWSYTGKDIPNSKNEKVDINLWLYQGDPPVNKNEVEIVISKFEFVPK